MVTPVPEAGICCMDIKTHYTEYAIYIALFIQ